MVRWLVVLTCLGLGIGGELRAQESEAQEVEEPRPTQQGEGDIPVIPVKEESEEQDSGEHEAAQLETIVVTASKRPRAQRELPGSVGTIRGDELEQMRAQGMKDYLKLIPGVSYNDQGTESSVPTIRGIAAEIGFGTTAQTTGIYLDDMPFADVFVPLSLPDLNPFDLERVEVLKGPQGTLFGAGALAGAVRYVTNKPSFGTWEAKAMHGLSETNLSAGLSKVTAGAVNAPLFGDTAALRIVGLTRTDAGLYDMRAVDVGGTTLRNSPDANESDQLSWRSLASWAPSDSLRLSALYFDQETHLADSAVADQSARPESSRSPFPSPRDHEFSGANVLATYDFDAAQLTSSTNRLSKRNYILTHAEWFFGLEDQNQNEWYDLAISDVSGFTQELRLASLEDADADWAWLVGAAHMGYENAYFQYEPEPGPAGSAPPDSPGELSQTQRAQSFLFATVDTDATERAFFGELTRRVGKRWEVTAGARVYETSMVADTVLSGAQVVALTQQTETRDHFELSSSGVNPKVALRYLHNSNVSLYALAAKGFQFGGVQLNPSSPVLIQSAEQAGYHFGPYDSSELWSYEVGVRTEWLDRRLRFDVDAFYADWKDLQLTVRVPIAATGGTYGLIANVGEAHSEGVEAKLDVIPFQGAKWTSAAAWIKAVTDVPFDEQNAAGPVPAGTRLPGTPRFQWSNVVSYEHAIRYLDRWDAGLGVTHSRVGASPDAIRPTGEVGGYDTLDAQVFVLNRSLPYMPEVSLIVRNITDSRAITFHSRLASPTTNEQHDFYHFVPPRTAMLSVSFRY